MVRFKLQQRTLNLVTWQHDVSDYFTLDVRELLARHEREDFHTDDDDGDDVQK